MENYPTEGVLQMQDYLRVEGYVVNYKRVRRLLRKMSIVATFPKRNLSKLGKADFDGWVLPFRSVHN